MPGTDPIPPPPRDPADEAARTARRQELESKLRDLETEADALDPTGEHRPSLDEAKRNLLAMISTERADTCRPVERCAHCDPSTGHREPSHGSWGVWIDPRRDSDGQPTIIRVERSDGAHVADVDAQWIHSLIRSAQRAAYDTASLTRRFVLQRDVDVTGVSGTGVVADGVLWPDGTASVRWRGPRPSVVFWDRIADAEAVHGHGGATRILWIDQEPDA